jgi:hypothetical protein
MEMIQYYADVELNLRQKDVEKYLLCHGWQLVEHPNHKLKVFDGELDDHGQPIRLALPRDEHLRTTPLRIYQVLETVAAVEDRSITEVADDIKQLYGSIS